MFHYQGSRTDKHVREHEVYAIGYPGEFTLVKLGTGAKGKFRKSVKVVKLGIMKWSAVLAGAFQGASLKQRLAYFGLPVLLLASLVISMTVWKRSQVTPLKSVVVRYYPDAVDGVSGVSVTAVRKAETARVTKQDGNREAPSKKTSIARVRTLEETIGAAAVMNLMVLPWGEVYLDGRMQGVSPPLMELQVAPGKHEIEIKNTNFPVYKKVIQVKVGEKLKVQHTFAN